MLKDFTKECYDIFVQAGQSNSEGSGFGEVEEPYVPESRVWYMNEDFTLSCAAEKVAGNEIQSNFALAFAREYLNNDLLQDGRKLLIIRAAVGGTGFLDNHWKMTGDLYLRMIEMTHTVLALNEGNRLRGLLWHQGETDAILNASYEVHYGNLMKLVRSVRDEFEVPDMPFIAGDFVHDWKNDNQEICRSVLDATRDVCMDCGCGSFVETDGLLSNAQEFYPDAQWREDTIHFSRRSLYELGKRYFNALMKIQK